MRKFFILDENKEKNKEKKKKKKKTTTIIINIPIILRGKKVTTLKKNAKTNIMQAQHKYDRVL